MSTRILTEAEKGALVVIATSYSVGDNDFQAMLGEVTNDYLNNDPVTIGQVQTYIETGAILDVPFYNKSVFGLPVWGWGGLVGLAVYIGYNRKGK